MTLPSYQTKFQVGERSFTFDPPCHTATEAIARASADLELLNDLFGLTADSLTIERNGVTVLTIREKL